MVLTQACKRLQKGKKLSAEDNHYSAIGDPEWGWFPHNWKVEFSPGVPSLRGGRNRIGYNQGETW